MKKSDSTASAPSTIKLRYTNHVPGEYWNRGWRRVNHNEVVTVPFAGYEKRLESGDWEVVSDTPKAVTPAAMESEE